MGVKDEILPNLFRIEVPLPENPLKFLNSYVIKSNERNLVIDTGLKRPECMEAMTSGLKKIGIDLSDTDFLITHLHTDHFGLIADLATKTSRVYLNRNDARTAESWEGFDWMIGHARMHGMPEGSLNGMMAAHPEVNYGSDWLPKISTIDDGQELGYGDYRFTCIETPGHTEGHTCLYEAKRKILVSGDHILMDISPNIQCWSDDRNPLRAYIESLKKTYELSVELVLPGHRRVFTNHRSRIRELLNHHEKRLAEVQNILYAGFMSAYEVAAKMSWDIQAGNWEEIPIVQRWFATGEALSHLRYLEEEGLVKRELRGNEIVFFSVE